MWPVIKGRIGSRIKKRGRTQFFGQEWHSTGGWGSVSGGALPSFSLNYKSWSPQKIHHGKCTWSDDCIIFGQSKREYFLSKQQI